MFIYYYIYIDNNHIALVISSHVTVDKKGLSKLA